MTPTTHNMFRAFGLAGCATLALAAPAAAEAPVKQIVKAHIGWKVNKADEGNVCLAPAECAPAGQNGEPGGLEFPEGIAVNNATSLVSPEHGDVYVAEAGNQRVQVFSSAGAFVLMFGWNVNRTKEEEGAPQAARNVCTALSKDACQAGSGGGAAGQFSSPTSLAIDPATGNVYVEDVFNWRVQEFTATGEFVLMLGKEVNETTGANLCTAVSKDACKAGEQRPEGSPEEAAFAFEANRGGLLQIGGPEHLLYVGDRERIDAFHSDGTSAGDVPLGAISSEASSFVAALAVTPGGDIYLVFSVNFVEDVIYEVSPTGEMLMQAELNARQPQATGVEVRIGAIALDPAGRLAVTERERGTAEGSNFTTLRGSLYEVGAQGLALITEFVNEFPDEFETANAVSVAFDVEGGMYAVGGAEVISYKPVPAGALTTKPAVCAAGADEATNATVQCRLEGEANPWNVGATEVWFQWGKTVVPVTRTARQALTTGAAPVSVNSVLTGLAPNETYYFRQVGEDQEVKAPETFRSETASVTTPPVPPRIVGEASALHAGPFSAVMFAELNPENAPTTYRFQYGPCEELTNCTGLLETAPVQDPAYGAIGSTVEVSGLLPGTLYHFRLTAESAGGSATSATGAFTTASGPAVTAETKAASAVGTTTAMISGAVNPNGQAATYVYEVGRDNGSDTRFGIVFSAPAGAGATAVETSLELSGLEPGTAYAYRIAIHSGDGSAKGEAATGATKTFTTEGLPIVFTPSPSPLLSTPAIAFPRPKILTNAQKLAIVLRACKHKPRRGRLTCERKARKRYGTHKKNK